MNTENLKGIIALAERMKTWLHRILRDRYIIVGIILIVMGTYFLYCSSEVTLENTQLRSFDANGQAVMQNVIHSKSKHPIQGALANGFIPFGVTLLITMFFVNTFDRERDDQLKGELKSFQENTAKDAVQSIFKNIVDESFWNVIKDDVLNCQLIRKNAYWKYALKEESGKLILTRTISYTLQNLSSSEQTENLCVNGNSNQYTQTVVKGLRCKFEGKQDFEDVDVVPENDSNGSFTKNNGKISVKPNSSVEIIKIIEQTFSTPYVYETHFANNPLQSLSIEVEVPAGYKFQLSPNLTQTMITSIDLATQKRYRFEKAILKGQGVEFYIEKSV